MASRLRDPAEVSACRFTACEFRVPSDPELVTIVRQFVTSLCERSLGSREAAERVALTTHELLENTVKYSTNGESSLRLEVAPDGPAAMVSLITRNQATTSDIEALEQRLAEMSEVTDAFGYYLMVLRRSGPLRDRSGLGLARVFAEAETEMSMQRDPDDTVTVTARTRIDLGEDS
jgi:anti-sigma regulatory factor (Ser/Thr protein kinase)